MMLRDARYLPTRRAVLGGLAASAASLRLAPARAQGGSPDVVIIGAGAAGIGAAIALGEAKLSCMIVEARDRLGGRAYTDTTTFRSGDKPAVPFDIGCAWIHRFREDDPFAIWARRLDFDIQPHDLAVSELYYDRDLYSSAMVERLDEDEATFKKVTEKATAEGLDVAGSSLVEHWYRPMDAAATYMGPMDMGVDLDALSSADYAGMADYDPNYLVRRGYGTLVKAAAEASGVDKLTIFGAPVSRIDYSGRGVRVYYGGSKPGMVAARAAIVTVSTGVLNASLAGRPSSIKFDPGLPEATQTAIAGLPMGLLAKIPLQIPGISHYLRGVKPYDNLIEQRPNRDDDRNIYFLAWPWDSDLVVGFVGGRFAWELSQAKDGQNAAIAFAKERLGDIFGSDVPPKVTNALFTPWATDPYALGAYSAALPGRHASRAALAVPVQEKLFFAGEATGPKGMYATASGAYDSGRTAAQAVAATLAAARP